MLRQPTTLAAFLFVLLAAAGAAQTGQPDGDKTPKVEVRKDTHGDSLPTGALERLGTVRFRHNSTAIAFSPNGNLLASGGRDNTIRLYEATTGKEIRRFAGHQARTYQPDPDPKSPLDVLIGAVGEGGITTLDFSPDGTMLASGGWDDTVRIWDVQTGKQIRKIDAHKAMVGRVLFAPSGRLLASRGALDGSVRLWEPTTGVQVQKFVGLSKINPWRLNHDTALSITPDAKTLVTTARESLVFFDIPSGAEVKRVPAHVYGITAACSPDGKLLATGGVDAGQDVYSLRIWDAATGKELRKCELPKNEPPTYISWDPRDNGKFAAVVAEDNMHIFDAHTGKEVETLKHYWPSKVVYSPDGKSLASAGSGPTIRRWDANTGKEINPDSTSHQGGISAVAVSPDGKYVASGGEDLRLWDAATHKLLRKIDVKGGVTCLALAPDSKTLAAGGRDRIVRIWDAGTGNLIHELKGHKHALCGLAFSRDGKLLASGDVQATVRVWDPQLGMQQQAIDNKSSTEVLSLAFGPDNKTLVCGGAWNDSSFLPKPGSTIKINGKEVKIGDAINIQGIEWARHEGYYVLAWDATTGKEVRKFGGLRDTIRSMAYSPDGKLVAAASKDGRIVLWDAETGKDRLHIMAHPANKDVAFVAAPALAFSPDSKTLASAGSDRTIRLWNVVTAQEVGQLRAPDCSFQALTFDPSGKKLVTGGADTELLLWDVAAAAIPLEGGSKVITIR
jgi:WD40 repeat protein